ncbi:conserved hypothetical protein [Pediculus humanus corporis]|uniref:Uncharacterized protein n=1 Tax=Pediculus humanus subsp. corporis TaxID=121224 RepID=E0W091_PEDHC|nr:uncharacterized protein Phum_PHUM547180 [Pediculus humanus corporis]EEB19047.1 conserved hypothetical protein [Pediculus humanus corporis]
MFFSFYKQRPPSSSLSYGPGNDDVRSPGSGGTPGPLSQPPGSQQSVDTDPGNCYYYYYHHYHFVFLNFFTLSSFCSFIGVHYYYYYYYFLICFQLRVVIVNYYYYVFLKY